MGGCSKKKTKTKKHLASKHAGERNILLNIHLFLIFAKILRGTCPGPYTLAFDIWLVPPIAIIQRYTPLTSLRLLSNTKPVIRFNLFQLSYIYSTSEIIMNNFGESFKYLVEVEKNFMICTGICNMEWPHFKLSV